MTDYQQWDEKPMEVNVAHVIRGYMAGYAGGASFAREMAQNADDAKSNWLRFNFEPDRLVVSNGSIFSERDFEAISEIAAGSKRDIQDNIGTWGTGFLSVYQLTDHPELCSAGRHLIFDPRDATYKDGISNVVGHTEFHFPWRKHKTEISRELDADVWDTSRITKFQQDLSLEIYRLLPFLRCVNNIAVYQGSSQKLFEITRKRQSSEQLSNSTTFERWLFSYEQAGEKPKRDDWLFYRASLPAPYTEDNRPIKSPAVAIGLCLKQSGSGGELPGTLYNFLPTDIDTGFKFHFNGDFFPDSNRKSILKGDGSSKSKWNERVLATIGWLFAHNLEHLRDQCASPAAFYRLLPVSHNSKYEFLQPIVTEFLRMAAVTPLIKTTDEQWNLPRAVKLVENSRLFSLSQSYLAKIAPRTNSVSFPEEMTRLCQQLGAQPLRVSEYLTYLKATLWDATPLAEQPEPANSREKFYAIFDYFSDLRLDERAELLQNLDKVPLFLDETGCLQVFGKTSNWLADNETREILPRPMSGIADPEFQSKFSRLLGEKVQSFGPREMVLTLRKVAGNSSGKFLAEAHPMVNSRPKLGKIYDYLIKREVFSLGQGPKSPSGASNPINLKGLPLVVTTNHQIRLIGDAVYLADNETRQLLAPTNPVFVSPEINEDSRYRQFLYKAGVPEITPAYLIELLKVACREGQKHPLLDSLEKLKQLYTYFQRRKDLLSPQNRLELQQLPFILTKQGQLAPAIGNFDLRLPPPVYTPELQKALEILEGDYLVNEKLLTPELRPFFTNILMITELSMSNYLEKHVATQYERVASSEQRLVLLGFIRDQLRLLQSPDGKEAVAALSRTRLILCHDGQYRRPTEVYFPSTLLAEIFPHGYNRPDLIYNIPTDTGEKSTDKNLTKGPESSPWYPLFDHLGISKSPTAADLVSSISRAVAHPPTEQSIKHIDSVYRLINTNWVGNFELDKADFEPLRNLRWLPAEGRTTQWYAPQQLYWASLRYLIWSRVEILPFAQSRREFSDFLGLNVTPKLSDVVSHLLHLSNFWQGEGNNIGRIYTYLKDFADDPEINRLKNKPVIYDGDKNRYWSPEKVFLGDYSEDFGPYRGYLTDNEFSEYTKLFSRIGVRNQPETPKDYLELVGEIANQNQTNKLDSESERCLNRAYIRLAEVVDRFSPEEVKRLKTLPLIIDKQTNQLTLPANCFIVDREDLYDKFPAKDKVRRAKFADQQARPFLLKLGVRELSSAVQRRLINYGGVAVDSQTTQHLQALVPHLKRLVEHYRLTNSGQDWQDLDLLKEVEVKFASQLQVQYVIEGGSEPILGRIEDEKAIYLPKEKFLYILDNSSGRNLNRAIAFELAHIMNPSQDATILAPLLAELLSSNIGEADKILNDYHIKGTGATGQKFETQKDSGQSGIKFGEYNEQELTPEPTDGQILPPRVPKGPDNGKTDSADSAIKPEPDKEKEVKGQSGDKPTPPSTPDQPKPSSTQPKTDPIPPFAGKTPSGPRNFTDYYGLARKYGAKDQDSGKLIEEFKRQDKAEMAQTPNQLPLWEDEEEPTKNERVDKVRFVLSFMNRYEGYLPLKKRAVALLAGQTAQIRCRIDDGQEFPLYIDRERRIIYNQEALPAYFAAYTIPAGGIVYLEREHASLFRLYFKSQPHTVQGVKLAEISEDGKLEYTVVDMEVPCETEDCVFIAEKRLEEPLALFLEARGKKSVFETIIDIFEVAKTKGKEQLHQNEIFSLVFNTRMISHATVGYELARRPCFVNKGESYWSFDSTRVLESFNNSCPTPPAGPKDGSKPTNLTTGQDRNNGPAQPEPPRPPSGSTPDDIPTFLSQNLDRILERLQRLTEDKKRATLRHFSGDYQNFKKTLDKYYRELERPSQPDTPLHGPAELARYYVEMLNHSPGDPELQTQLENALDQLFDEAIAKALLLTPELETVLREAEEYILRTSLKPYFAKLSGRLAHNSEYEKVAQLWKIYRDFDPDDDIQAELAIVENTRQAGENYQLCTIADSISEKLELLREALKLDPTYLEARKLYDILLVEAIIPLKENIRRSLSGFKLNEALQYYAELQSLVSLNITFAYHSDSLQNDLVGAAIMLLDFIGDAHNQGLGNKEQYLVVAQLYLTVPGNTTFWRKHKQTYFNTLSRLGHYYYSQNQPVQAAIFYARAVQFFDEFRLTGNMADEGQKLAEIYEVLGLWDWSHKIRTKLLSSNQLSQKEIPAMRNLLQRADIERNSLSVRLAHDKFAQELQQCQQDKGLITAVGASHLALLVKENQAAR